MALTYAHSRPAAGGRAGTTSSRRSRRSSRAPRRTSTTSPRRRGRSRSTRPATRSPRTSTCPTAVDAAVDPQARRLARPPPGDGGRGALRRAGATRRSADIVWGLGAMAAEHVFYGENGTGVGGDVQSVTTRAAAMVGFSGMGPMPVDLSHLEFASDEAREEAEQEYMQRFERIGQKIMNRSRGMTRERRRDRDDPARPAQARAAARRSSGRPTSPPSAVIRHNREQVAYIADALVERKELFGDEVVELLRVRRARSADHRHHRRDDLAQAVSDRIDDEPRPERRRGREARRPHGVVEPEPRLRPPDPAGRSRSGTPPSCCRTETPRAAAGRLWAPAADGDAEVRRARERGAATRRRRGRAAERRRHRADLLALLGALPVPARRAAGRRPRRRSRCSSPWPVGDKDGSTTDRASSAAPAWSTWQPAGSGLDAADADRRARRQAVPPAHRQAAGGRHRRPAGVRRPPGDHRHPGAGRPGRRHRPARGGRGVLYRLCGTNGRTGSRA